MPTPPKIVETYFKQKAHMKLKGKAYQKLKESVFDRDNWMCIECGSPNNLTLSHKIHKGMGGKKGPGDVESNCVCRCMECHIKEEHGIGGRIKK